MTALRRRLPLALMTVGLLALVVITALTPPPGRLATGRPSTTSSPSTAASPAVQSELVPRVAIVYDVAGRGREGFNELTREGVQRAGDVYDAELKVVTTSSTDTDADREALLEQLADDQYYPIFVIGSTYAVPLARVAPKYPDTWFGIVDDGTVNAPNVVGIRFNEEQGAFLVGAAAALSSKTGKVGFVGAIQIPLLQKYEAGFTAGARAADPKVKVQVAYLSPPPEYAGPSDPTDARKAALRMYDAGADVIFAAGGDSNDGVIQAAHDRGLWAIGADSDRYATSDPSVRGNILTSMLKRPDNATYTILMEVVNSVAKDGNNVFGVGRGGVGYSTSGGFVDPIKAQLDDFAARIASGEILVRTTP